MMQLWTNPASGAGLPSGTETIWRPTLSLAGAHLASAHSQEKPELNTALKTIYSLLIKNEENMQ